MILYYFFDPLCGWCYGFTDITEQITTNYPELELRVVCGGMVLGQSAGIIGEKGQYILNVLPRVGALTGCDFGDAYIEKLKTGELFCSSYRPSLALVIVKAQAPEKLLTSIKYLQKQMFYFGKSLEDEAIYTGLAEALGWQHDELWSQMQQETWHTRVQEDFEFTANVGIQGFPTLVAEINEKLYLITHGWGSYEAVEKALEDLLVLDNA